MKKSFKSFSFIFLVCVTLFSLEGCNSNTNSSTNSNILEFAGATMGTTYSIKIDKPIDDFKRKIDSTLIALNKLFSTYDSTSQISKINNKERAVVCFKDEENTFTKLMDLSRQIYESTNHYFDPTVMPLVNYWGFGPNKVHQDTIDNAVVDSIKLFVGFERIQWSNIKGNLCFYKYLPEFTIDLSAIAKGYAVDILVDLIEQSDVQNYMVEIGGEVRARGKNPAGENWKIGIDRPISTANLSERELQAIVSLDNKALASSGNYRNFYTIDDKKVGHTINPVTGMPEVNNLLAVSVLAHNCATADGYATAFMAMGLEESLKIVEENNWIDAYFIYIDSTDNIKVNYTSAFNDILIDVDSSN